MGLELEALLVLDDLEQGWNELLVVLMLGNWAEFGQDECNAAQSSVSNSLALVRESLACSLHGGVEVSLQIVSARLSDQTEGHVACLSDLPVGVGQALLENWSGCVQDEVLFHIDRESANGADGSGMDVVAGTIFALSGGCPDLIIFFALGKHLNESWEEQCLSLVEFPEAGWRLGGQCEDDFSSL